MPRPGRGELYHHAAQASSNLPTRLREHPPERAVRPLPVDHTWSAEVSTTIYESLGSVASQPVPTCDNGRTYAPTSIIPTRTI
jgi:hypothetical protein